MNKEEITMSSIFQQHCQAFAKEEHDRQVIMHALMDTDKKLMGVDIPHAIDTQFEPEDVQEMYDCGMTISDIVNYMTEKYKKLQEVKEALEIAEYNLQVNLDELDEITKSKCMEVIREIDERFGGDYNDQT
jgi:hypothetical protein